MFLKYKLKLKRMRKIEWKIDLKFRKKPKIIIKKIKYNQIKTILFIMMNFNNFLFNKMKINR